MNEWTFRDEIRITPLNVPRAALQYARQIAYPTLNIPYYMLKFEELAMAAQATMVMTHSLYEKATRLAEFLFVQEGFEGNDTDYGNPQNSFLNDVLERRLGIPISLSVLYMAVGTRLNIPAQGIGMPGHFIVMVKDGEKRPLFLDPFNEGKQLSENDCTRLIRLTTAYDGSFQKHWLDPVDNKSILTRMLNNLRLIYIEAQQWQSAATTIELLRLLHPQATDFLRDLGVVHYQAGSIQRAVNYLEAYLQQEPNAPDIVTLQEGLRPKIDAWVRLN